MNSSQTLGRSFYVVSMGKFTLLYFGTLGIYSAAWFFMHWVAQFKAAEGELPPERQWNAAFLRNSAALLRSIFAIFFVHNLFSRLRAKEQRQQMHYPWNPAFLAIFFIGLQLLSALLSLLVQEPKKTLGWMLVSFSMMVAKYYILYKVQLVANRVEGDAFGRSNGVVTFVNAAFLGMGAMFWFSIVSELLGG